MSNDPDLLDKTCHDCNGEGTQPDSEGWYDEPCDACDGEGVVLR